ncbi:MAG: sigma-54 dependent transcriptional regulator [Trichloromonas sp.]|jgi:two-component system nitrogen regulation response regulator GlnG|nr:sigma-54 dependent transcriptional regulator [Trichloromonas sp.]
MSIHRILVADDEESIRWVLAKSLGKLGYQVELATSGDQALTLLQEKPFDLAVLDIKMPGLSGLDLLSRIHQERPGLPIVVMTAESTMINAVEAMKRGAYDYLTKPFDLEALDAIILRANQAMETTPPSKTEPPPQLLDHTLIGRSRPMQEVYKVLGKVAASDVTVLITGESGTGKELVARAIHGNSARVNKPFLALNCAAIPRELLESELFGFEKGAFTGANERKIGKFEQAHGGSLFLDEIGDMPLELQAKLLRVLQEKEITRTGGVTNIPVDVRIIAATNQDLQEQVRARGFREDLYYRLNVIPISLPALRERAEDIPLLVDFFLRQLQAKQNLITRACSADALTALQQYPWPGNVRELENAIQRAALLSPNPQLTLDDFPFLATAAGGDQDESLEALIARKLNCSLMQMNVQELDNLYEMVLHQMERPLINIILEKTRGNQVKAAEILGINRNTLRKKIQALGIDLKKE